MDIEDGEIREKDESRAVELDVPYIPMEVESVPRDDGDLIQDGDAFVEVFAFNTDCFPEEEFVDKSWNDARTHQEKVKEV